MVYARWYAPQGEQPAGGGAQRQLAGQQRNEVVATWAVFSAEANTMRHERDGCRPVQIVAGTQVSYAKGDDKVEYK